MAEPNHTDATEPAKSAAGEMADRRPMLSPMIRFTEVFKRSVAAVLMVMMMVIVVAAVVELGIGMLAWVIPTDFIEPLQALLSVEEILAVLGVFLTVLIALELIETVEVYFKDHAIHVEIVVAVAIIAIARKFILLDPHEYDGWTIAALGFVALALGVVYWLVRRSGKSE